MLDFSTQKGWSNLFITSCHPREIYIYIYINLLNGYTIKSSLKLSVTANFSRVFAYFISEGNTDYNIRDKLYITLCLTKKFVKNVGTNTYLQLAEIVSNLLPVHQLQSSPVSLSSTEASQSTVKKTSSGDQAIELKQLHQVNSRLDTVGQDMVTVKQATHKQTQKISSFI